MPTTRRSWLRRFLSQFLLSMVSPVLAVEIPRDRGFPTRTIEIEDFRFDPATGLIHQKGGEAQPYLLTIDGMVETPLKLDYRELRTLPAITQVSDFHCVEGWTVPQVQWTGIRFEELLRRVQPTDGAAFVVFHSLGTTRSAPQGQKWYVESFAVKELLDPQERILLAYDMDGKPLSHDRGAPLRVIAPLRQAYKSAKYVWRIEFTDKRKPGWWTLANPIYDVDARVPRNRLRKE